MTLTVNTNVASLNAQKYIGQTQEHLSKTLNRLSSGLRINEAKDDAAGLAISEGLVSQIRGMKAGARNGNDGISLIQTAEGAMNQTLGLLQRMRELAVQASSETYETANLANSDEEFQRLKEEIDRVAATAEFNNITLLNGGTISIQIGAENTANDRLTITLTDTDTTALTINASDLTTNANAQTALDALNTAIATVTTGMATLGANHSNLEAAVNGNIDRISRLEDAKSRIKDTDYAEESSNLAKFQILQQSGVAMLAQANSSSQVVLRLLQG